MLDLSLLKIKVQSVKENGNMRDKIGKEILEVYGIIANILPKVRTVL